MMEQLTGGAPKEANALPMTQNKAEPLSCHVSGLDVQTLESSSSELVLPVCADGNAPQ